MLFVVFLALTLGACSLGESEMPEVPAGAAADRSVGQVMAVPNPIAHELTEERLDCFRCHVIGALSVPEDHDEGMTDCISCHPERHGAGIADAPPLPEGHEVDVTLCTTCHAVWLAPAIAATQPPAIPHGIEGYDNCLVCHKMGVANAPRMPGNHGDLDSSDICQACHVPGAMGELQEGPPIAAPHMPHGPEVDPACSGCHAGEVPGVPQLPPDHAGRTDDLCRTCHTPGEAGEVEEGLASAAPNIPHGPEVDAACGDCHAGEVPGVPQFPADHEGRADDVCAMCHQPAVEPVESPQIPHSTEGFNSCAICHGNEGTGAPLVPDSHQDWPDDICKACHQQGG
jgi:cytochrome c5